MGYDVTVLEKNRQPGGLLRSYTRGVIECALGVHYLGSLDKGQILSTAMLNRTTVKGLYLADQNVLAPGVIGTIMGSFSTVKLILGADEFHKRISF